MDQAKRFAELIMVLALLQLRMLLLVKVVQNWPHGHNPLTSMQNLAPGSKSSLAVGHGETGAA
jgi:flagellar biogenesis protein FliO